MNEMLLSKIETLSLQVLGQKRKFIDIFYPDKFHLKIVLCPSTTDVSSLEALFLRYYE